MSGSVICGRQIVGLANIFSPIRQLNKEFLPKSSYRLSIYLEILASANDLTDRPST